MNLVHMVSKQKSDWINFERLALTEVCKIILLLLKYVLDKVLLICFDGVVVHNWNQIACDCTIPGKFIKKFIKKKMSNLSELNKF